MESGSARRTRRRFWHKFQDITVSHRGTRHRIVKQLRQFLLDQKKNVR
jgi:hypothetical protein